MSGFVRGVKLFYKAEYCDTLQSKEGRTREYKVCLNDRALRLLDHNVTWKSCCFSVHERGDFCVRIIISSLLAGEAFAEID